MGTWRRTAHWPGKAPFLAGLLSVAVAGCSSSGEGYFRRLGDLTLQSLAAGPEAPRRELTRAELNQIPYATIAVSSEGGPRAYLVPQAENGGYLDYRDESGNSVRILGGAVAGLETAGQDLDAVLFDPADPIAHPRPLASWPRQLWRQYQFSERNAGQYVISLRCVYQPLSHETVEIVEISFSLVHVEELCTNARRSVTNSYWVEAESGFIWKSRQWLGPKIGQVVIEVIRPYSG